jgi:hypothetical protein
MGRSLNAIAERTTALNSKIVSQGLRHAPIRFIKMALRFRN